MPDDPLYPFYLDEQTILDLIEAIEDMYAPSDGTLKLLEELEKARGNIIDTRIFKEVGRDLSRFEDA